LAHNAKTGANPFRSLNIVVLAVVIFRLRLSPQTKPASTSLDTVFIAVGIAHLLKGCEVAIHEAKAGICGGAIHKRMSYTQSGFVIFNMSHKVLK
jgi:hypothetical protein